MDSALFTPEQEEIILGNPIKNLIDAHRDGLPRTSVDTKYNLRTFLRHLSGTKPADLIKFADSPNNLGDKLYSFISAWSGTRKFPMTLKPQFSSLLEIVASGASDLDIWTAIVKLLKTFDLHTLQKIENTPSYTRISSSTSSVLRDLQRDWNNNYFPHSLDTLQSLVRQYQKLAVEEYYAKTLVFVQSSGTGKSRLVDSFGQVCPMINFVLREEESTGFPSADGEILSFLREKPPFNKINIPHATSSPETWRMTTVVWNHTLAAALLQASFEKFNIWVKNQPYTTMSLEALASSRHTDMAPLNDDSGQRPINRIKFCQSVAERARVIANNLISNTDWVTKFSNEASSQVHYELQSEKLFNPLNGLRTAAENLINDLQKTQSISDNDPYLVIVFDEASSIMRETASDEPHPGLYIALNRIISYLKRYSLWSFFLSTESLIGQLVPPGNAKRTGDYLVDSSARLVLDEAKPPPKRFPPFVALQLDVEDRRRMLDPDKRAEELRKPLSDFAKPRHMALFGRPLWHIYENPVDMNRLAKFKLLGGQQYSKFNPNNKDHVFAALSFRLSLDICLQNPASVSFTRTAVSSFMRVVISMDKDTGIMDTLTPSEPVLAKAAMEHLCYECNWLLSILTLTEELLEPGLIEKGQKGELYARLVLILAHDLVRWVTSEPVPKSAPKFQPTFTVFEFLRALYGKDQMIPERIGTATMNFTHFVPAYETLTPEVIPALCHDLLRRSAAMQLAFQEATVDLLLPIYYGKENEEFNPSECGVILVQVKNQIEGTTPHAIFNEAFTKVTSQVTLDPPRTQDAPDSVRNKPNFAFKQMEKPILFLLFDLGVVRSDKATSPLVQVSVSQTKNLPELWAIHSRGHDKAVFGCMARMDPANVSQQFFDFMPKSESVADQLARRNKTFYDLQRSYRYLGFDSEQEGKIEADDGRAQEGDVKAQENAPISWTRKVSCLL